MIKNKKDRSLTRCKQYLAGFLYRRTFFNFFWLIFWASGPTRVLPEVIRSNYLLADFLERLAPEDPVLRPLTL